jgi:hypothetical protein
MQAFDIAVLGAGVAVFFIRFDFFSFSFLLFVVSNRKYLLIISKLHICPNFSPLAFLMPFIIIPP